MKEAIVYVTIQHESTTLKQNNIIQLENEKNQEQKLLTSDFYSGC